MFGRNPVRKRDHGDGQTLLLQGEPWKTIQGEGPYAGLPATFIRLWGCHLKCTFCDTDFETDQRTWHLTTIADACRGGDLVVLTGGEPMRQNIAPLCETLINRGLTVQVETAGGLWVPDFTRVPEFVVSPKTPEVHVSVAAAAIAWKYIINATMELKLSDGLPITDTQRQYGFEGHKPRPLARPLAGALFKPSIVYVQPMDEYDVQKNSDNVQRCIDLALKYGYRVSLQQHKILKVL
jgi:organic radical activating enzyme